MHSSTGSFHNSEVLRFFFYHHVRMSYAGLSVEGLLIHFRSLRLHRPRHLNLGLRIRLPRALLPPILLLEGHKLTFLLFLQGLVQISGRWVLQNLRSRLHIDTLIEVAIVKLISLL